MPIMPGISDFINGSVQLHNLMIVKDVIICINDAIADIEKLPLAKEWKDAILNPLRSALQATENVKTGEQSWEI